MAVGAATITATDAQTTTLTCRPSVVSGAGTATCWHIDLAGFTAAGYCAKNLGTTQQVTLSLTQSGLTLSGTMTKAEGANLISGPVSGTTGINGDITLTGTLSGIADGANVQLALISWNSLADGANMTGTWSGNITSPQILGLATLQWSLRLTLVP
jgi:hypothetical protein